MSQTYLFLKSTATIKPCKCVRGSHIQLYFAFVKSLTTCRTKIRLLHTVLFTVSWTNDVVFCNHPIFFLFDIKSCNGSYPGHAARSWLQTLCLWAQREFAGSAENYVLLKNGIFCPIDDSVSQFLSLPEGPLENCRLTCSVSDRCCCCCCCSEPKVQDWWCTISTTWYDTDRPGELLSCRVFLWLFGDMYFTTTETSSSHTRLSFQHVCDGKMLHRARKSCVAVTRSFFLYIFPAVCTFCCFPAADDAVWKQVLTYLFFHSIQITSPCPTRTVAALTISCPRTARLGGCECARDSFLLHFWIVLPAAS